MTVEKFAPLYRLSDKNLIRWYRKEFEMLQKGTPITKLLSPGEAITFKRHGITQKVPGTSKEPAKTILSVYGRELFGEILEEDDEIKGE